jgi:hypothetical protein
MVQYSAPVGPAAMARYVTLLPAPHRSALHVAAALLMPVVRLWPRRAGSDTMRVPDIESHAVGPLQAGGAVDNPLPAVDLGTSPYWLPHEVGLALMVDGIMNPGIFHPQWFVREHLLRPSEAEAAKIQINTDDYALFRTQDFTTEVTRDGLTLLTRNEAFEPTLKEIFSNIFRLLKHTPIKTLTISRFTHWKANPTATIDENLIYWEKLFPLKPWNDLLEDAAPRGIAISGVAMNHLQSTLAVEPSSLEDADVYVGAKYTWDLTAGDPMQNLVKALEDDWAVARTHAKNSATYLLDLLAPPSAGSASSKNGGKNV